MPSTRPSHLVGALGLLTAGLLAACSSPSSSPPPTEPASSAPTATAEQAPAWPMYHHDTAHTGAVGGTVGRLRVTDRLRLDGAVYASPLVVPTGRGSTVVVATENDTVYGLRDDKVAWSRHVGTPVAQSTLPCGNIDPLGITGTPVYDPATRLVYAVAEVSGPHHDLVAVDPATGEEVWHRSVDPQDMTPAVEQQRGALTVSDGRVMVPFGGLSGDCGPYRGRVVSLPAGRTAPGADTLREWVVPTPREGGMWQAGGVVTGPDGSLYEAVGNGASTTSYDGSDAVVRLSPDGQDRRSFFAPSTWQDDNAKDLDLGSAMPLLTPDGDVVQAGKRGVVYLARQGDLGGIGGEVDSTDGCQAYGGGAVATYGGSTLVLEPCTDGVSAFRTTGSSIRQAWRVGDDAANGSPVVVGDTVLVPEPDAGKLAAVTLSGGTVRHTADVGTLSRFATPAVSGHTAYLGTMQGLAVVDLG